MSALKQNKDEIIYNIINSFIAGALVFLGSVTATNFNFTIQGFLISFSVAGVVALTKFKDYWATQEGEYKRASPTKSLFCFIGSC
jgi:hypothetical protein